MSEAPFDSGLQPDELDHERPAPIETPWGSFALFEQAGTLVAVDSWCPHMKGPLFQGTRGGDELVCPWHGWRYSLADGSCTWAPEQADRATRIRRLRVEVGPAGTLLLHPPGR